MILPRQRSLIICLALCFQGALGQDVPQKERDALVALYDSTMGSDWIRNDNWRSSQPVSEWYGVTVTDGRVTGILFPQAEHDSNRGTGLSGTLPSEIGDLDQLTFLDLGGSIEMSGPIPPEIGNLTKLGLLRLWSVEKLTGSLPIEMGALTELQVLDLGATVSLNGPIPDWIGNLSKLEYLFLHDSGVNGQVPDELYSLASLKALSLGGTAGGVSEIKSAINNLGELGSLTIQRSEITGLPDLDGLTNLTELFLMNNQLESLPQFDSSGLDSLWVQGNRLDFGDLEPHVNVSRFRYNNQAPIDIPNAMTAASGGSFQLPVSVGGSRNTYQWFKGSGNSRQPIPGQTSSRLSIEDVDAQDAGTYSMDIWNELLPDLKLTTTELQLTVQESIESSIPVAQRNALIALFNATDGPNWANKANWNTEADPETWEGVTVENGHVVRIVLEGNNLVGTLPKELGDFPELRDLFLGGNGGVSGRIPPEIGNLSKLQRLKMWGMSGLEGDFPSTMQNLTELTQVHIHNLGYALTGDIPDWINKWSKLEFLQLSASGLSGAIPVGLFELSGLLQLTLSAVESVPDEILNLTELRTLAIRESGLTTVPDLSTLPHLIELDLFDNRLSDLPPLTGLTLLDVTLNRLSFADLEPFAGIADLRYERQADFEVQDMTAEAGTNFSYSLPETGENDSYTWYKGSGAAAETVDNQVTSTLSFEPIAVEDAGTYWVEATNSLFPDLTIFSTEFDLTVREPMVYPTTNQLEKAITFTAGETYSRSDWHLISLPGAGTADISTYVNLPGDHGEEWYAYVHNGKVGEEEDYFDAFSSGDPKFRMGSGRGVWIGGSSGAKFDAQNSVPSVTLNASNQFGISVHSGWNTVGNPFQAKIAVSDIVAANPSLSDIAFHRYKTSSGTFEEVTALDPYEGYYFNNTGPSGNLLIPYLPVAASTILEKAAPYKDRLDIVLEDMNEVEIQRITVRVGESEHQIEAPPPIAGPEMRLRTDNSNTATRDLVRTVTATETLDHLSVIVSNANETGYRISIHPHGSFLSTDWVLHDTAEGSSAHTGDWLPVSPLGSTTRRFEIVEASGFEGAVPEETRLWPSYPNPAHSAATIPYVVAEEGMYTLSLYTVDGRLIADLDQGLRQVGRRTVRLDVAELGLASGVYVARLLGAGVSSSTRLLVVR